MASCKGDGDCFEQCGLPRECEHASHMDSGDTYFNYFKHECAHNCVLLKCQNFHMCGQMRPKWVLDCDNGMCNDCGVNFGRVDFLGEKGDCPVCLENKELVRVSCTKHRFCLDCWKKMSETTPSHPLRCGMCRQGIWK